VIRNLALIAIFCALVGACHELQRIADVMIVPPHG
jgi:hypothetical protein